MEAMTFQVRDVLMEVRAEIRRQTKAAAAEDLRRMQAEVDARLEASHERAAAAQERLEGTDGSNAGRNGDMTNLQHLHALIGPSSTPDIPHNAGLRGRSIRQPTTALVGPGLARMTRGMAPVRCTAGARTRQPRAAVPSCAHRRI